MPQARSIALPCHSPGQSRQITSYEFGPADASRKFYFQAGLHADETPGIVVLHRLKERLEALEHAGRVRGRVCLVPLANPIGAGQFLFSGLHVGRFDLNGRENFNRHFPDLYALIAPALSRLPPDSPRRSVGAIRQLMREALREHGDATELQAMRRALLHMACDADWVIDLHCDNEAVTHVYTTPDLWPEVQPLARLLGSESHLLSWKSGDQVFDEACSRPWLQLREQTGQALPLACRAVTVELRGQADVDNELVERDAHALLAFLAFEGAIDADIPVLPAMRREATALEAVESLTAPATGVLVFVARAGQEIAAGSAVAWVVDPSSGERTAIVSRYGGLMFARTRLRLAYRGAEVAKVAGSVPHRGGELLSQ